MVKRYYEYKGAVMEFDKVVAYNWQAGTWAATPEKAASNLCYQFV
jgi:hypothetical protein